MAADFDDCRDDKSRRSGQVDRADHVGYIKDINDPAYANSADVKFYLDFVKKYIPDGAVIDGGYAYALAVASTLMQVLRQCGDDLSRENVMRQAADLHDLEVPMLVPGIRINTAPTRIYPATRNRWRGSTGNPGCGSGTCSAPPERHEFRTGGELDQPSGLIRLASCFRKKMNMSDRISMLATIRWRRHSRLLNHVRTNCVTEGYH